MARALGISVHTGWAACVIVAGTLKKPEVIANQLIDVLDDAHRFCFHMAAEMKRADAEKFLQRTRKQALANAKRALAALLAFEPKTCAIVAKAGDPGTLDQILASHPRLHTAEGCLYRDVLSEACPVPVKLVPASALDVSKIGKLSAPPWGRDQKLAALAAFSVMRG
jgi:hypothetical protein